jgi:hypothetical protein
LDILTNEFHGQPLVLISDLAGQTDLHYVEIVLEGRQSNRDGLGAMVELSAGDLVLTRSHDGKSGYLSQSAMPIYFGLGEEKKIDRIEVRWPNGQQQTFTAGLGINRRILLVEAGSE